VTIEPTPGNVGNAISTCNRGLRKDPREYLRVAGESQDVQEVAEYNQTYVSDDAADRMYRENIYGIIVT
jgi:hypothetical protein